MATLVKLTVQDMQSCSILSWYDKFKKHTIKSLILPLPQDVLAYMKDKGTVVLPQGTLPEPATNKSSDDEWDTCDESQEGAVAEAPNLREFDKKIAEAIAELGGSVFPKLNWSAPKDATWIALNNSLRCTTAGDIYLILKSSCFINHDLHTPFKDCIDENEADTTVNHSLVLRQWTEINPSYEFRGYVKDKELVGISQRDISQSYPYMAAERNNIRNDIMSFWHEVIENKFPLDCYTFDIYRPAKDKIKLIDFNVLGTTTDPLLFKWHEFRVLEKRSISPMPAPPPLIGHIDSDESENGGDDEEDEGVDSNRLCDSPLSTEDKPIFRFITETTGVQPSHMRQYGIPVDIGLDPSAVLEFLRLQTNGQTDSSDEELSSIS